jgi:hypothetical protein
MLLAAALACFVLLALRLAFINNSPGTPDSATTLHIARNILEGRGLKTHIVCQHFRRLEVPHAPTHRKPGLPLLTAALFKLFGVSLKLPVLFNMLTVILAACLLVVSLRLAGAGWFSYFSGVLLLVSPNYVMGSLWNNNPLVLCTVVLLLIGTGLLRGTLTPLKFSIFTGLVGAVGFLLKPTYIVTVFPFAALMLVLAPGGQQARPRTVVGYAALTVAVTALLTSPCWIGNLLRYGTPIYSVQPLMRLSERHGALPHGSFQTVRFGRPPTYTELIGMYGMRGLLGRELGVFYGAVKMTVRMNPYVCALAFLGSVVTVRKENWTWYAMAGAGTLSSFIFPAFYFGLEDRYFWPIFPCLLFTAGLVIRDLNIEGRYRARLSAVVCILLALGVIYGSLYAAYEWNKSYRQASTPTPGWVTAVAAVPKEAVVLTNDPWSLAWYGGHKSVMIPAGPREDLMQVVEAYEPEYVLLIECSPKAFAFTSGELRRLASSDKDGPRWILYRLKSHSEPQAPDAGRDPRPVSSED